MLLAGAPAIAQQKAAGSNRAMERAVAEQKALVDDFNKHDAAAIAALYASNAVLVGPTGDVAKGRAAIEQTEANTIKGFGNFKFASVVKDGGAVGNGVWFTFETTIESKAGSGPTIHVHGLSVLAPDGGKSWKLAATSLAANVPPPGAPPAR
jgi:ketosteroid isomerase-like protein